VTALPGVQALCFDVFGTVVDFRTALLGRLAEWGGRRGVTADWGATADALRAADRAGMAESNERGEWRPLDEIRLAALREVLPGRGLPAPSAAEERALLGAWREGPPWPEAAAALARLRRSYVVSPLSNGTLATLVALSRHGGLTWDCVIPTELVRRYKPDPDVYRRALELLNARADEVAMVAAHHYDLRAAAAHGMRTAFVTRPLEFGPEGTPDLEPDPAFDVVASDLDDLADRLGA
jgi:2-haloacid dehalogenase